MPKNEGLFRRKKLIAAQEPKTFAEDIPQNTLDPAPTLRYAPCIMKIFFRLCLSLLFLGFIGCTSSPPKILQVFYKWNVNKDIVQNQSYESLSVFVLAEDEDGIEDLDSLCIIHDESEQYWTIPKDQWIKKEQNGQNWIGTNAVTMHNQTALPRGKYRVILLDAAGERDRTEFNFTQSPVPISQIEFPSLELGRDVYVKGIFQSYYLWFFSLDQQFLFSFPLGPGMITREQISKYPGVKAGAAFCYLYTHDPRFNAGILAGPYNY